MQVLIMAADGHLAFQEVFMFSHRAPQAVSSFVTLRTGSGREISASAGHYIWSATECSTAAMSLRRAADVAVGHFVMAVNGTHHAAPTRVVSKATSHQAGLFNPHTQSGSIVVNGVAASVFTDTLPPSLIVHHVVAAPAHGLYMMCKILQATGLCERLNDIVLGWLHGPTFRAAIQLSAVSVA